MTINFDTIANNYEVIYVIETVINIINKNRYEFSSAFIDQRLPNLVHFIYQQHCYQLYYSYLFCCFVEIKKYPCGAFFYIVYLHLQWNAVP
jgi:hypothetical protein